MSSVVLLRGVNVGKKRFSSVALAKHLGASGIGAAGTYVVKERAAAAALRKRIAAWLPFECEILVCTAKEIEAAIEAGEAIRVPPGAKRFATLMARKPATHPKLPLDVPEDKWGVRVAAIEGRFVLGVRRSVGETGWYPNEFVETTFGVKATTRDWGTMEKVRAALAE